VVAHCFFDVNLYAQAEGILEGLARAEAPGIIQASRGANKFQGGPGYIYEMVLSAREKLGSEVSLCLHLDHGDYQSAEDCIQRGFSSVMADFSTTEDKKKRSLEENTRLTREVVKIAKPKGVSVEGEIGVLKGQEEDKIASVSIYPTAEEVIDYVRGSGIDAVAVACGTCHGPVKDFKKLELKLLEDSYNGLRRLGSETRIVLHGSSTIPAELVEELRRYGCSLSSANGVRIEEIKRAIKIGGVRKVNIDSDLRMGITAEVRKYILENLGVERNSEALAIIKNYLFGSSDNKNTIDPRDYFSGVMKLNPDLLRQDYRIFKDRDFMFLMIRIKNRVAKQVEFLVREFGSAGLSYRCG
jgi:fructose-bisphosphate aldolase class II